MSTVAAETTAPEAQPGSMGFVTAMISIARALDGEVGTLAIAPAIPMPAHFRSP